MLLNPTGAVATGLTVCVVIIAKFAEGAWITLIAIPGLLFTMYAVKRYYEKVRSEIDKGRLLLEGSDRISVLNIPWYWKTA
jgi:hypothetical protein